MQRVLPIFIAAGLMVQAAAPQYTIQTVAGSDLANDWGAALYAPLVQPEALAMDPAGNLYIADAGDHRVRMVDPGGRITTIAGTGRPGFSGDGGPAKFAQLNQPYAVALDDVGNIYIADLGNARVRCIDVDGNIRTIAGGGSTVVTAASSYTGVPALEVQLNSPRNLRANFQGSVYFSDFGAHTVYRVYGGMVTLIAGTGHKGSAGDGGAATSAALSYPAGLAFDSNGLLYIADSGNGLVRRVKQGVIDTIASIPQVVDIAFDANNNLYVAAPGALGWAGNPLSGSNKLGARSVLLDASGDIIFSTGQLVNSAGAGGLISTIAGWAFAGAWGDGQPATEGRLFAPAGVAVDSHGQIYIADTNQNRIRKVDASGVMTTVYGSGDPSVLNHPQSVVVSSDGTLFVADTGNGRVLELSTAGTVSTVLSGMTSPSYLYLSSTGGLYVCDNGGNSITSVGPKVVSYAINQPVAVAVDASGAIYASQTGSAQIMTWSNGSWTSIGATGLIAPAGLALDQNGNLLVADSGLNQVLSVTTSGATTAIAGTGVAGFNGDTQQAAAAAQLSLPMDVAVDSQGRIFVADTANNRIRMIVSATPPLRVLSSASFAAGPIAPNEIISLFGAFDPASVHVLIGGIAATLFYADAKQINALVPGTLPVGSPVTVTVQQAGVADQTLSVDTASAAPALFTSGSGTGQAAAFNWFPDPTQMTLNSSTHPLIRGSYIELFATGNGTGNVMVNIGGEAVTPKFSGWAPGFAGLMQVNVQVPANLSQTGNVPITLSIGNATSPSGVTIAVE